MIRTQTVPIGTTLPNAVPLDLNQGEKRIEAISVDNQSDLTVSLYTGTQGPNATPVTVPPNTKRTFPHDGNYAYIAFGGTPNGGVVYLAWSDDASILPADSPITNVITQISSSYPQGATPFSFLSQLLLVGGSSGFGSTETIEVGQSIYISTLFVKGIQAQMLRTTFTIKDAGGNILWANVFTGYDIDFRPALPIVSMPAIKAGTITYYFDLPGVYPDAPVGSVNADWGIAGYFL